LKEAAKVRDAGVNNGEGTDGAPATLGAARASGAKESRTILAESVSAAVRARASVTFGVRCYLG
jgi:hypothetical protein